ncbi:hypothetical protein FisN_9Hh203 [Fistulifera solaris]|uniref:Cytochrome b-c1 complex subunit 7 n=1 Tax=Fistulifera solaris TaxID=1519565 RepID=A0A1Z5JB42_FISSO|nr:hypothetical protein FisN_9Hh203 [Fistulifera solaris]|eukprot:GAX11112.1 hypothetical protein FisN_9Hh203 [Fistulifera solaris]
MDVAAKAYKGAVASELNKIGLRYEDLLNSSKPSVEEALALADPDVLNGRMRRLKRASDLCVKQKRYIDYAEPLPLEEVFKLELSHDVDKIEARDFEFQALNLHKK